MDTHNSSRWDKALVGVGMGCLVVFGLVYYLAGLQMEFALIGLGIALMVSMLFAGLQQSHMRDQDAMLKEILRRLPDHQSAGVEE